MSTSTDTAKAAQGQTAKRDLLSRLQAKKPQTATYDVVLDPGPLQALQAAQDRVARAELFADENPGEHEDAVAERDRAAALAEDAIETLHFTALGRLEYEALLLAHPATADQKARGEGYNVDTFVPAIVAATVVDPDTGEHPLSVADVVGLFAVWNQAEVGQVWQTALSVCTQARNPSLPFGFGATRGSRSS